jgi:LysM repeat protein
MKHIFFQIGKLGMSLLVILAILSLTLPQPQIVQAAECSASYTVKAGDTLSAIAVKYNTTVEAIAQANNLKSPYTIYEGQVLCIPGTASSSSGSGQTSTKPSFTASFSGNKVTIKTKNYPKQNVYYVTAQETGKYTKYQIGKLLTKQSTSVTQKYTLPKDLRERRQLTICLKNIVTDSVQCNKYTVAKK